MPLPEKSRRLKKQVTDSVCFRESYARIKINEIKKVEVTKRKKNERKRTKKRERSAENVKRKRLNHNPAPILIIKWPNFVQTLFSLFKKTKFKHCSLLENF